MNLFELDGPVVATETEAQGEADEATENETAGSGAASPRSDVTQSSGGQARASGGSSGKDSIQYRLIMLRREMGELEWAMKKSEEEEHELGASLTRLESEAVLLKQEMDAKLLQVEHGAATEKRTDFERQLAEAKASKMQCAHEQSPPQLASTCVLGIL